MLARDSLSPQMGLARAGTGETIVDSKGAVVGRLIGPNIAERLVGNQWLAFPVTAEGFSPSVPSILTPGSNSNPILFQSTDCSGQGYMQAEELPINSQVVEPSDGFGFNSATL